MKTSKINIINVSQKLRIVAVFVLLSIAVYVYLFNHLSYTADKCRSEYSTSGSAITVAPGDPIGSIIYGHGIYLKPGTYKIRIDGYNEYKEYNIYEICSDKLGEQFSTGVFVPGQEIVVELEEAVPDLETRVGYQDAGTVTVEKVTITRINSFIDYLLTIVVLATIVAVYFLLNIHKDKLPVKIIRKIIGGVIFIIFLCLQFVFIEALYYNDTLYYEFQRWFLEGEKASYLLLMSIIILAIIDSIIIFLCKYFLISILLITILSGVYALVGHNYYLARGEAFTFEQLQLAGEATKVLGDYTIIIPNLFWIMLIVAIISSLALIGCKISAKIYLRLVVVVLAVFLVTRISASVKSVIAKHGDETVIFVAQYYYTRVGYLVGTFVSIPSPVTSPDNYSQATVEEIITDYFSDGDSEPNTKPNIIYIQCESLFDLTKVQQQTWSDNPLTYLDELSSEAYVGNLVSPMVGGGTANVEYEMLTGYNYYNTNGTPFINGIKNGQDSFVSDLNEYGYDTVVIHTNVGTFYNRDNAYTYLGMDRMIFEEQLGEEPDEYRTGVWANDRWAYKALIDDYENRDDNMPYFAQVVTTQNHGAYEYEYDAHDITINGDISIDEKRQLQTYLNLEQESMDALKEVIDYFSNVKNNVIIVCYGDHCPALSYFGITGDTMDFNIAIHETPLVVWNNYGAEFSFANQVSAYNFTAQLMRQLGYDCDTYMNYTGQNQIPMLIGGTVALFEDGSYTGVDAVPEDVGSLLDNMWILQYDRVYGKKYSSQNE